MRHLLFASTCLFAVATACPVAAQTKIESATTTPVRTATIKAGSSDDILITAPGSITTTAPAGVTIDTNNKVTNQGAISIGGVSGANGIVANAIITSGIVNSGKITIDEGYTATDTDNDGDVDGPFAVGSNRVGIGTLGAFNGDIVNSGAILIEGNDSAGILLGGALTGKFTHDGSISVIGNNALGIGLANVNGNARLAGTVNARGLNATAVRASGNVNGALVVQGAISATGYRYTTPPADTSKLDADDLLQGGPAISIEGNVTGGIILAVPPKDQSTSDNDEDKDGLEDSKEGAAAIASYGSAAALRVGHTANAVAIGPIAGTSNNFGLIIDGNVLGSGLYTGIAGNAVQIGGLGGTVSIANGLGVSGTVTADSLDRLATAIRIGTGATTPELRNSGRITAASGKGAQAEAVGVVIEVGGNLPTIRNSGEISAAVGSEEGKATAIIDRSGTLALVDNSGAIVAKGASAASNRNVAIDLSVRNAGTIVRQTAVAAGFTAPRIDGDIRFGGGDDLLDILDGSQNGNVTFGAGNNRYNLAGDASGAGNLTFAGGNDVVTISGTASLAGNIDFGGGADQLSLTGKSVFTGQLTNSANLAVSVSEGTFNIRKMATVSSLTVASGGTLGVLLDGTAGNTSQLTVSGAATFGANSKLQLSVADVAKAEGTFMVLSASSLSGASNLTTNSGLLPYLYKGTLAVAGNNLNVTVTRKSASELELNASESAAFSAIYTAIGTDKAIGDSIIGIRTQDLFKSTIRQMLPEHAGGAFEAVTAGNRAASRILTDPTSPYKEMGRMGYWASQVAWGSSKAIGSTAGFKIGGWGVNAGADVATPVGRLGASLTYLHGKDSDKGTDNELNANQYGVAGHWRLQQGGFQASARAGWARVQFDGSRFFRSNSGSSAVDRTMQSEWNGDLVTANAHVAQQLWARSFYLRPSVDLDYSRLNEDAHKETGGGTALDLTVDKRTSDELALSGLLAAGIEFGPATQDSGYFTIEVEGGRREIVSGSLGKTVARFGTGPSFTLTPEERRSGWVGSFRALAGNSIYRVVGDVGAEERDDRVNLSARVSLALGF